MGRCEATVFGERCHNYQCTRTGSVKREGRLYCKQHDPVAIEATEKARSAKWERKWAADEKAEKNARRKQKDLERKAALGEKLAEHLLATARYADFGERSLEIDCILMPTARPWAEACWMARDLLAVGKKAGAE